MTVENGHFAFNSTTNSIGRDRSPAQRDQTDSAGWKAGRLPERPPRDSTVFDAELRRSELAEVRGGLPNRRSSVWGELRTED